MCNERERHPLKIEIIPAVLKQQKILANLLELYMYEFSEFYDVDLRQDGKFGYKQLPLYWVEPERHPFLIRIDDKWAGFVLLKKGSEISGNPSSWEMAEFFVVRKYRRQGIGTHLAHEMWRQFPGEWEVSVLQSNISARPFWERAISSFTGKTIQARFIEKEGDRWDVFSFHSQREPLPVQKASVTRPTRVD